MQRALGGAENSRPPTLNAQPQPKDSVPSQNPAKKDTLHSKQMPPSASQPTKPTEGQKLSSQSRTSAIHPSQQMSQQKPLPQQTTKGAPPAKTEIPSKTEPSKKEESGFFGFGGARSRSPSPQPGASSVSGKVLGFGSSFLSSASNLISAVQDEPSTTPPTKGSTVSQTSAKNTTPPSSRKGSEASKGSPNVPISQTQEGKIQQQQNKPQLTQKTTTTKESSPAQATKLDQSPKPPPKACPLCKANLRRDPPNCSTCTECKATVCNQCGFNPVPHQTEAKEWLCLNCQTQRALKGIEPVEKPTITSQTQPSKSQKMTSTHRPLEKYPTSQPTKTSPANQPGAAGAKQALSSMSLQQLTAKNAPSSLSKAVPQTDTEQEQSGFFGFSGFGGARSPSPQPNVSAMSGKALGFGSSFLSSASDLISSAVQDEPSTTPLVSQTFLKTTTPPTSATLQGAALSASTGKANQSDDQKEEKKTELTADQKNKAPVSQIKKTETSSQMPKSDKSPQTFPKSCPLCKVQIRKDLDNYNTCTECKNTVCNLCGFNPTPHQTKLKEWLCLNCQTQRALRGMEPPGLPKLETAAQPNKIPTTQPLASPSIQKKGVSELEKLGEITDPPQKLQEQQAKTPNGTLPIQKAQQQENEDKSEVPAKTAKKDSGLFGFGGARSRSPSPQPAMSAVSGKVLGFGSSFLNSASNLISSAVQDETFTTPPTSRKASTVSQTSTPPTSQKSSAVRQTLNAGDTNQPTAQKQEIKISGSPQLASKSPVKTITDQTLSAKVDKTPLPLPKICPLCKADISSDPPNFSTCTNCKNIVCNHCGFNPTPYQIEVKEWLCLNCQIKRASEPSSLNPQQQTNAGSRQDKTAPHQPSPGASRTEDQSKTALGKHTTKSTIQHLLKEKPAQKEIIKSQEPKESSAPARSETTTQSDSSKKDTGLFGFGFGGARSRSPSPQPIVSEKVLGFGSSFLSSASNLISSVVQDESSIIPPTPRKGSTVSQTSVKSTTPPTSHKGSSVSQTSFKTTSAVAASATSHKGSKASQDSTNMHAEGNNPLSQKQLEDKKPMQSQPFKSQSILPSKLQEANMSSQSLPKECPLCKVELKKDPPNFNTCTECKSIVCNLCGFLMPHQIKAQEWLCLTCQVQRASVLSYAEPQDQTKKVAPVPKKKEQDVPETRQKKQNAEEATNTGQKTAVFGGKEPTDVIPQQVSQMKTSQQMKSDKPQEKQSKPPKVEPNQEESGFFGFGFGVARSRSPSPQPASVVSGKVLGIGSSFLSTASNLMYSAVQDEPSTTPPTSCKGSSVSETTPPSHSRKGSTVSQSLFNNNTTSPSSQKGFETTKGSQKAQPSKDTKPSTEQKQEEKTPLLQQAKEPSNTVKQAGETPISKPLAKVCPLCEVELKKDQYNSCTECKNIVCNLCGFNPMPHQNEKAPEPLPAQLQPHAKEVAPLKMGTPNLDVSQKKPHLPADSVHKDKKPEVADKQGSTAFQMSVKTTPPTSQKEYEATVNSKNTENTDGAKTTDSEKGEETTKGATPQQQDQGKTQDGNVPVASNIPEESKSQSPLLPHAASAVSGEVLGFGSSLFSSASNLISSAVDEPSTTPPMSLKGYTSSQLSAKTTTPPSSHKGSSVSQTSDKITSPPSSRKGSGVSQISLKTSTPPASSKGSDVSPKMLPSDDKKDTDLPETTRTEATKSLPKACPLCKVNLQKEPPNYDNCTECKTTVCNLCGFNPMPHETEKKEWLCLNCQMQRAQAQTDKVSQPVSPQKKATPTSVPPQKKPLDYTDVTEKEKTALSAGLTPGSRKASVVPPTQKLPQQQDIKNQVQPTQKDDTVYTKSKAPPKTPSTKEESGLFGFGRSRSPSPQPAVSSVSGKVFGFGSSMLSSASNLISTAVLDESSTTLLATQEVSAASQTPVMTTLTSTTSQKGSVDVSPKQGAKSVEGEQKDKKPEEKITEVQEKAVIKEADQKSEPPKACPLCKAEIMKNPPNYSTCTTCKSTVCNLCGFNPVPHQTEVKEWLCLNCQMQRAPKPPVVKPGTQTTKLPPPASPKKQDTGGVVAEDKKQEWKPNIADSKQTTLDAQFQKNVLPVKSDNLPKSETSKQDSDFFSFGFGGSHSRSPSPQPTLSVVSGKVLGFGSSFLSSASNLNSSAVQDELSKTPPTSRKGSTVSQTLNKTTPTPPTSRKASVAPQDNKANLPSSESNLISLPTQEQKKPPDAQSSKPIQAQVKEEHPKTCPLCKETLRKDPLNYSSCTSCKSIVCNLCGFNPNPHQTEVKEWLCLTCQMQRTSGPPPAQPQYNKVLSPAFPQKEDIPEKKQSVIDEQEKKPHVETTTPATPNTKISKSDAFPSMSAPLPKGEQIKEESSFFGFGGARSRSPSPQTAVSDKVFGFGSSILSSASNLISSAVQEESSTKTPSTSRKGSTVSQTLNKTTPTPPTSRKGSFAPQDAKQKPPEGESKPVVTSMQEPKPVQKTPDPNLARPPHAPEELLKTCPLCKETLKKDPRNYSSCSSCQKIVCNLCGFNPNPHQTEVREWICLTCQVQRTSGLPLAQPQPQSNKVAPASIEKKATQILPSPEKRQSVPAEQDKKPPVETKKPTITPTPNPQKSTGEASTSKSSPSYKVEQTKEESSFFGFGLGGARSRSPSPQSAVSEKCMGFGSSFLSSASNLISSAIQDESTPKNPPSSRKGSTVSQSSFKTTPTPPTSRKVSESSQFTEKNKPQEEAKLFNAQKQEEEKKEGNKPQDEMTKEPVIDVKINRAALELPKTCPICKVDIKCVPPNYNTCTECKDIMCNMCGFNPMPHQSEVKEWLCLNCQGKKAQVSSSAQPQPQVSKAPSPTIPENKEALIHTPIPMSSKNKPDVIGKIKTSVVTKNQENKPIQATAQSTEMPKRDPSPAKSSVQQKPEPSKEESGFFSFGLGGVRSGSPQPSVTAVSGKVLGLGSSFLSSASNLISSAVQDESFTTPPVFCKASTASETSTKTTTPPTSRRASVVSQASIKTSQTPPASRKGSVTSQKVPPTDTKAPITNKPKEDKTNEKQVQQASAVPEASVVAVAAPKADNKACPLCKVYLNVGSKDTPNYNTCTECKNTVCNLCGFNPTPNKKVNEWLCLNCQTQRALNGMEPQGPHKIKTHEQSENFSISAPPPRTECTTQGAPSLVSTMVPDVAETQKKEIQAVAILDKTKTPVLLEVQKKASVLALPKPPVTNIKIQSVSSQKKETSDSKKDKKSDIVLKESEKSPEKAAPPPQAEPPKQESSFFGFGFGSPKVQPASKPYESTTGKLFGFGVLTETARSRSPSPQSVSAVSGKVLGFGSSLFSSASNLISSAVQDEPSTKPSTSRKASTVSQTSVKTTPPTSAVALDGSKIEDTKPHAQQGAGEPMEKKPEIKQVTAPKPPQKPTPEEVKINCPLCKVQQDVKNFNTCTECKTTVCSQCGFNLMLHQAESSVIKL
ncbi:mucin-17-like [Carassius carassius]|uniref:mucin-17-like n=1 Tax=Carassius carassius TaxID=217509 RepID=UPI002868D641|nr:mucin-17-like [Carassius carassius]